MVQLDLMSLIPQDLKQAARDVVVDFVADQARKYTGDELAAKITKLRSNAAFNKAFQEGLQRAARRFVAEYEVEDEDLVAAIAADKGFFKNKELQAALLAVLKQPSADLVEPRGKLVHSFDTVLPQRKNRARVDRAVIYLLKCLAEERQTLPGPSRATFGQRDFLPRMTRINTKKLVKIRAIRGKVLAQFINDFRRGGVKIRPRREIPV